MIITATMEGPLVVGICTCDRPNLLTLTLESLAELNLPEGRAARLVLVDNGRTTTADAVLATAAPRLPFEIIEYLHEPRHGIAFARNRILQSAMECGAQFLAMVDDDELVYPDWLTELVHEAETSRADVVFGPVETKAPDGSPGFLQHIRIHGHFPEDSGHFHTAITGNVLIRIRSVENGLRFDESLGLRGGEDSLFFETLHARGKRIRFAKHIRLDELLPLQKAHWSWILQRTYVRRITKIDALMDKHGWWRVVRSVLGSLIFDPLLILASALGAPLSARLQATLLLKSGRLAGSLAWPFSYRPSQYQRVIDLSDHEFEQIGAGSTPPDSHGNRAASTA
jgi:succinoglycan biosynthesis protein ExoM